MALQNHTSIETPTAFPTAFNVASPPSRNELGMFRSAVAAVGAFNAFRLEWSRLIYRLGLRKLVPLFTFSLPGVKHKVYLRTGTRDYNAFLHVFVLKTYGASLPQGYSPKLIIDCGANVGYASVYYLNRFPGAAVVAVEPEPGNLAICERNLAPYADRALLSKSAVWSRPTGPRATTVPAVDIPTLMELGGGRTVDLLRIDVERSELELFTKGQERWLPRVRNIAIELHGADCSEAFFNALADYNYSRHHYEDTTICQNIVRREQIAPAQRPVHTRRKVLHIVGCMSRGGVETWLMHILRNIDQNRFELHFFVNSQTECAYDKEILSLGGRIHYGGHPGNPVRYAREFAEVVREHGPFNAVHSHVYWFSGFVAWLGHRAGIPVRIAHSHTAVSARAWKAHRRAYQVLMRWLIARYATHHIGVSRQAGEALFGSQLGGKYKLLHYGMDFRPYLQPQPVEKLRQRLGIPPHRKIIGHVGRFVPVKNHAFIVEFFDRLIANGIDAHLLLVGDGPLAPAVKALVESRALSPRCTFAGLQADVAPFFSAMDVFVLPSLWEGLPLVSFEAQAAGVPVIASTAVPEEVSAIPRLVERIPLSDGAGGWAAAVSRTLAEPSRRLGDEPMLLQTSTFGLPACLQVLTNIYSQNN